MEKKSDDKQTKILKAAMQLIAENGFHGSPTSMIAKKAGVGTGTIYRYFESKDGLIEAIHRKLEEEMHTAVLEDDSEDLPVRERYIRMNTKLIGYFLDHPYEFSFMEQYYNSPYGVDKRRQESLSCKSENDPYFQLLSYAREQHIIKNFDMDILFSIAFGPIVFLVKDHLNGFVQIDDNIARELVKATWDALKL